MPTRWPRPTLISESMARTPKRQRLVRPGAGSARPAGPCSTETWSSAGGQRPAVQRLAEPVQHPAAQLPRRRRPAAGRRSRCTRSPLPMPAISPSGRQVQSWSSTATTSASTALRAVADGEQVADPAGQPGDRDRQADHPRDVAVDPRGGELDQLGQPVPGPRRRPACAAGRRRSSARGTPAAGPRRVGQPGVDRGGAAPRAGVARRPAPGRSSKRDPRPAAPRPSRPSSAGPSGPVSVCVVAPGSARR